MENKEKLYPVIFEPILKEIIWGGYDICPFKGIEDKEKRTIGESWEISHVDGNVSIVANGSLKGKSLDELISLYGAELMGKSVFDRFGSKFPLLIKFIDARDNLSIQVHPDDDLALKRHNSFGKTEMWYVVKATRDAKLYSGFKLQSNPDDYVERIKNDTIMDALSQYDVKEGDVFFLPAGRVHAIGAGCFVAEIQQTSNITYRIFDYNRTDKDGNKRELHTQEAKDAINYEVLDDYRTKYSRHKDEPVQLVKCKYFETNILDITKKMDRDLSCIDSFVVYICLKGQMDIIDNRNNSISIHQGQSILVPADTQSITIAPQSDCKILETYIG